jgi:hypothetical protein
MLRLRSRQMMGVSLALTAGLAVPIVLLAGLRRAQAGAWPATVIPALVSDTLIWPLTMTVPQDSISSPFGPRWQTSQNRYDYHSGLDLPAPANTPVHVITDGVVSKVDWPTGDSGLYVLVYHPTLNLYSAYLHLNAASVTANEVVTLGQVIGYVGDTGTTKFYHLHFEIRLTASDYPTSTRNPMGYLPRPDVTTPTISIASLDSNPVYSPTVTLVITAARDELDLNQIRVFMRDQATGALLDDQLVDFNQRLNTGDDTLNQNGIQLIPSHFNTSTVSYVLTSTFYALHGFDSFTLTAQAIDLAGHIGVITTSVDDLTPPGQVTSLNAQRRPDGGIILNWIAPGDSDNVGRAMTYEVRYAGTPINNFTWSSATALPNSPAPLMAALPQTWFVSDPLPDPVYFALKTADAEGNWSLLSNSARAMWRVFLPILIR